MHLPRLRPHPADLDIGIETVAAIFRQDTVPNTRPGRQHSGIRQGLSRLRTAPLARCSLTSARARLGSAPPCHPSAARLRWAVLLQVEMPPRILGGNSPGTRVSRSLTSLRELQRQFRHRPGPRRADVPAFAHSERRLHQLISIREILHLSLTDCSDEESDLPSPLNLHPTSILRASPCISSHAVPPPRIAERGPRGARKPSQPHARVDFSRPSWAPF